MPTGVYKRKKRSKEVIEKIRQANILHYKNLSDEEKLERANRISKSNTLESRPYSLLKKYPKEYKIWRAMNQRCYNKNLWSYKYYGQRGITVCDRWRKSFENFIQDMGPRERDGLTIERYDNDGPYCKENCGWETMAVQSKNKRLS